MNNDIFRILDENKNWIFSGIGIVVIRFIYKYLKRMIIGKESIDNKPVSSISSDNVGGNAVIAGRDMYIIDGFKDINLDVGPEKYGRDVTMLSDVQSEILDLVIKGSGTIDEISRNIGVTDKMASNLVEGMVRQGLVSFENGRVALL